MVFPVDVLFFTTSLSLLTSSVRQDARGFFLFLKGRTWGSMKSADTAMVTNKMLEPSFVAFGVQMSWPYTFLLYRLGRGAVAKRGVDAVSLRHLSITGMPVYQAQQTEGRKEPRGQPVSSPVTVQTFPVEAFLEASVPTALPTTRVFAVTSYFSFFSYTSISPAR